MEFKIRANIVMSKELTPTKVFYDEISPMKWMNDEKWMELCATQRL